MEADAVARPDQVVNPVDLGTILVPAGWLLLAPDQSASLEPAAVNRTSDVAGARLRAWFESDPGRVASTAVDLRAGLRVKQSLALPQAPPGRDRDTLRVLLDDGQGHTLWKKTITTMLVPDPPRWPKFGATTTRLRYDEPISVRDPKTGVYSTIPYEKGWDPTLKDVVVSLPNGSRFVFWRGSSYIPFWAGRYNTGACYEWAEMLSRPPDAVDCVEPLMDKELRYGRVEVVESTAARIHVRWSYQSTDLHYQVWGDSAVEDYYFYPDGFGTRVLSLKSDPKTAYELSEFIVLTPPGTYPFEVLPENLVDALFLDGRKREFRFPGATAEKGEQSDTPAVYRLRLGKQEKLAAVYFSPSCRTLPPVIFGPFLDGGQVVTPCYWGSHWPLARGNATGSAIDDRVHLTPCHNSVMSWASAQPTPLRTASLETLDALGRSRPMSVRTWCWLIGMTDASDARLVESARSFARPPSLSVRGGRLDLDAYIPERRAVRLIAEAREVFVTIKPGAPYVNPVFEFESAPTGTMQATLDGRLLGAESYAWDGRTLWLDATITKPIQLRLSFGERGREG